MSALIHWKRGNHDHHWRGYVAGEVLFTLHKHAPPNNSHFSIWILYRGDVGGAEDGPDRFRYGNFPTRREARAYAEEKVGRPGTW